MSYAQLRPLSFGEILDGAFTLYRRHFSSMFLTALVCNLPLALFWIVMLVLAGGTTDAAVLFAGGGALVLLPLMLLGPILAWGALTYYAGRAYTGTPVPVGDAVRRALGRILVLLGISFIFMLLFGIGLILCIVPGLLVAAACFAAFPAAMLENKGPVDSISRSWDLAKDALLYVFGVMFVVSLIQALPGYALVVPMMATTVIDPAAAESPGLTILYQVANVLLTSITTPFMVAAVVLLYYDRRVRTEALDVQLAAAGLSTPPAGQGYGYEGGVAQGG